jgi:hypothetical protein
MKTAHERWDEVIAMQVERGRAKARKLLTEHLCAGKRMREALAAIAKDSVTLGIHAEAIAEEERGYSPAGDVR